MSLAELKRKDGAPVLGIAAMVMIPIIVVSMTRLYCVMNEHCLMKKNRKYNSLLLLMYFTGKNCIQEIGKNPNGEENTFDDVYYYYSELKQPETIKNMNTGSNELVNNAISAFLYHYKDGKLYPLSLSYQQNLSMEYQMPTANYLALKEAAEIGKTVYTEYNNYNGGFLICFCTHKK